MPPGWTWVHYKLIELAGDQTPLCDLTERHVYSWPNRVTQLAATTVEETRSALADLVVAGAVRVIRSDFAAEGSFVREVDLAPEEALAVLGGAPAWDQDEEDSWRHSVIPTELTDELLAARPPELDPHRPVER